MLKQCKICLTITAILALISIPMGCDGPDTTAPEISGVTASGTSSGAIITWYTDEPADSQVEYGLDATYGTTTAQGTTLVTSHSVTLSGLDPDTTYHYWVKSTDAHGNNAVSSDATFITTSCYV